MKDKDFVLETYLQDFLKAAKVNLFTGEYSFVKVIESEKKAGCLNTPTIDKYIERIVAMGLPHPDDVHDYLYHTDLKYLRRKIAEKKLKMVHSFRRKSKEKYIWVTFEITVPKNFSVNNPWVIFSWKESDSDTQTMEDALKMLSAIYHKIMKINLTNDTHEKIKVYDDEITSEYGFSLKASEWFYNFAETGNVYSADKEEYLAFTNIEHLRIHFKKSKDCIRCRYRRRMGDSFRWVSMELIPSIEYTDENQVIILYIRDIHDAYIAELNYQRELEYYCNYDILTGIRNRYYYKNFCINYAKRVRKCAMSVLFADINNLKYINDHYGHAKGDTYIKKVSQLLVENFGEKTCCRISGDEFVVFFENMPKNDVVIKIKNFYHQLEQQKKPIVSIGYAWAEAPETIEELVQSAEKEMYKEKKKYYKKFPKYAR